LDPLTHRVLDHQGYFWTEVAETAKTGALPEEAWTLAEALRGIGYQTAAWLANPWISEPQWGFDQGLHEFHNSVDENADRMIPEIQEWWQTRTDSPMAAGPVFLYLHFMDGSRPLPVQRGALRIPLAEPSLGNDRLLTAAEQQAIGYLGSDLPWRASERGRHLKNWRTAYACGVRLFDERLEPFLAWLRSTERLEQSVLVFTSDHGEDLLEHGRWNHGYALFQHSLRIPLMIRLPGARGAGRRDDRLASLVDVMPTLLGLAGRQRDPTRLDGSAPRHRLSRRLRPEQAYESGCSG